jgi:hypothetical protein
VLGNAERNVRNETRTFRRFATPPTTCSFVISRSAVQIRAPAPNILGNSSKLVSANAIVRARGASGERTAPDPYPVAAAHRQQSKSSAEAAPKTSKHLRRLSLLFKSLHPYSFQRSAIRLLVLNVCWTVDARDAGGRPVSVEGGGLARRPAAPLPAAGRHRRDHPCDVNWKRSTGCISTRMCRRCRPAAGSSTF